MLPNIRDDAINTLLGITQGNMSYADYTRLFNNIVRRSRQPLTYDLQCVGVFRASSVDWLTFNFEPKPSPIIPSRGVTLCLWWSYKTSSTTSLPIRHTWVVLDQQRVRRPHMEADNLLRSDL
jgi:hypothetical protein